MIHAINHDNKSGLWCGPAAIALITGQSTGIVTRMLLEDRRGKATRGSGGVKGTTPGEVYRVLRELGYVAHNVALAKHFSAIELELNLLYHIDLPILAATCDHWFVVFKGRYFDNKHPGGVKMPEHMRGQHVIECWAWRQVAAPSLPAPKPPPASSHPAMRKARKLAKAFGIALEYERDMQTWYVRCPIEVDEDMDDIFEGDHYASTPFEVLVKVEAYVELVEHVRVHGELS